MSAEELYSLYAQKIALDVAAKEPARPKPIVVEVEEPWEPPLTRDHFDPLPALH